MKIYNTLKETKDWMRRRAKRNAPPIGLDFYGGGPVKFDSFYISDDSIHSHDDEDKIASLLFDCSLSTKIIGFNWYHRLLWIRFGETGEVEIDADVIETILNWYRCGRKNILKKWEEGHK